MVPQFIMIDVEELINALLVLIVGFVFGILFMQNIVHKTYKKIKERYGITKDDLLFIQKMFGMET